jgi:hypothetical protein
MYRKRILKRRLNERYYARYRRELNEFNNKFYCINRMTGKVYMMQTVHELIQRMCRF